MMFHGGSSVPECVEVELKKHWIAQFGSYSPALSAEYLLNISHFVVGE